MIDMSVSGLVGIRNGSPSPISWVWGRPTTAPKPTPSRCYHQNHNPNLPTLVGMIRVQRSGGEYHPDPFPPLVGMTRVSVPVAIVPHASGDEPVVWGSRKYAAPVFPTTVGIGTRRHKRGGNPSVGSLPCLV